jgi:hypothetical protein
VGGVVGDDADVAGHAGGEEVSTALSGRGIIINR